MFCSSPLKKNPTEIDWNCRGDAGNGGADFSRYWRDGAVDAIEFPVPRFKATLKLYKLVDYSLTYFSKVNKNSVPDNFYYHFFNLANLYVPYFSSIDLTVDDIFRWTREWTSKSWLDVVGRETWQKDLGADRRKGCGATCVGRIVDGEQIRMKVSQARRSFETIVQNQRRASCKGSLYTHTSCSEMKVVVQDSYKVNNTCIDGGWQMNQYRYSATTTLTNFCINYTRKSSRGK